MTVSTNELQKAHHCLESEGHSVTREAKQEFSRKVANEFAVEGRWKKWAGVLRLSVQDWSTSKPSFGSFVPGRTSVENLDSFWVSWQAAFLCDSVLECIKDAGDSAAGIAPCKAAFEDFVTSMLEDQKDAPQYIIDGMKHSMSFARGILGLLVTTPLHLGTSQVDVNFICPLEGGSRSALPVSKVFPAGGKTALRYLEADIWKERLAGYHYCVGGESTRGRDMRKFMDEVQTFINHIPARRRRHHPGSRGLCL